MDTNDQYFDCLCRTCMNELVEATSYDGNKKPQQWQSIFDRIEEFGAFRIAELLTNAVPKIEVQPRDELPKRICSKCLQQLLSVYRFQQMCLQSQEQMRKQVSKKQPDLNDSMKGTAMEGEIATNGIDSYSFAAFQSNTIHQNLEHSSIQEPLLGSTEQVVKPEASETSDVDIDKLLEDCRDSQGNLSEFIKNEPMEYDEPSIEYSDGDTIQSIISVKGGVLAIESEEQQTNGTYIRTHSIIQGEYKPYECQYCPQRFSNYANMLQHKEIHKHQRAKREACDICGKIVRKYNLKQHKLTHGGGKPHKCHLCEKSFFVMTKLRIHIRSHTGEKPYQCKYCQRSFSQSSTCMKHMRVHLGENVYRCELCPSAFPEASALRSHLTTHTNESAETRERNMKALKEAEAEIKAELDIKYKEYVRAHSIIHGEDKRYECHYCPQRFSNYATMLQHKEIHKDQRAKREACDICGKIVRKCNLKQHKLTHGGGKPHKCHLCEKSFLVMTKLRIHIRSHTGEKPYQCKYCQRSFSQSSSCIKHMRVHLGENVYRCELCPSAFPVASALRSHLTTHTNESAETRERNMKALKEAEAEIKAELEIKYKEYVRAHSIIHGEDKRYECHYCPQRFSNYATMLQHKEIHKDQRAKREACDIKIFVKRNLKQHQLTHGG